MIPEILATLASGVFAGTALYISFVEHPARLSCGFKLAVTEWRASYKRAAFMQAPLALAGSFLAFLSWWLEKDSAWLLGGAFLFAVIPFTYIVILPTNRQLESDELDFSSGQAEHLLRLWCRLHAVRSALSSVAFTILLIALRGHR
jgi:uncharacterized membrane protein